MKATANVPIGAAATQEITVTRDMTVAHFHEHMPEVYGTPIMIYHMEVTAEAAIRDYLPQGWITVGVLVNVKHLAASPIGMSVRFRAEILEVADRRIVCKVEAYDEKEKIGEGTHERFIIDVARYAERLIAKFGG